jgi:hypothetical protein
MSFLPGPLRVALSIALPVALCSCSSSSGGSHPSSQPVIDDLTLPATFTASGSTYTAQGTITFHDPSAAVTGLREKIPSYNLDSTISLSGAGEQGTATIEVGFVAPSAVTSGTQVEIDISLIDANGGESNVEVEQVSVP